MFFAKSTEQFGGLNLYGEQSDFQYLKQEMECLLEIGYVQGLAMGIGKKLEIFCQEIGNLPTKGQVQLLPNGMEQNTDGFNLYPKRNLWFSIRRSWPEMIFLMMMMEESILLCEKDFIRRRDFLHSFSVVRVFQKALINALRDILSDIKIVRLCNKIFDGNLHLTGMAPQFLERVSHEYLALSPDKRKERLTLFIYRVLNPKEEYEEFWNNLLEYALQQGIPMESVVIYRDKNFEEFPW